MPYYQQTDKSLFPLMVWTTLTLGRIYADFQVINDFCAPNCALILTSFFHFFYQREPTVLKVELQALINPMFPYSLLKS